MIIPYVGNSSKFNLVDDIQAACYKILDSLYMVTGLASSYAHRKSVTYEIEKCVLLYCPQSIILIVNSGIDPHSANALALSQVAFRWPFWNPNLIATINYQSWLKVVINQYKCKVEHFLLHIK